MYNEGNGKGLESPQVILQAVYDFRQKWEESGEEQPNYRELIKIMEPIYKEFGYREKLGTGEQEILILSDCAAGDFVCVSPGIRAVRQLYSQAKITLFRFGTSGLELAAHCPYANEIIIEKSTYRTDDIKVYFDWCIKVAEGLLSHRFELAFCFSTPGTSQLIAYLAGARIRIGYKSGGILGARKPMFRGNEPSEYFQTVKIPNEYSNDFGKSPQLARRAIGMFDYMLLAPMRSRNLEVWFTDDELALVKSKLVFSGGADVQEGMYYIAVNLGASAHKRHYPSEKYVEFFLKLLAKEKKLRFLLIGGPSEQTEADIIMKGVGSEYACNLVGKLNYCETSAAISLCSFFIGNDSAPLHIALALGLPAMAVICYPAVMQKMASVIPILVPPGGTILQILPLKPLPECEDSKDYWGCSSNESHCITQIETETLLKAYDYLQSSVKRGQEIQAFVTSLGNSCLTWTQITDNLKYIVKLFYRAFLKITFRGCMGTITDLESDSMLSVPEGETAYVTDDSGLVNLRIMFNGDGRLELTCEAGPNEFNHSGVPCAVRYTSILVDGREVLNSPVDASVDTPLRLVAKGKTWQEYTVKIAWSGFPYDRSALERVVQTYMPPGTQLL